MERAVGQVAGSQAQVQPKGIKRQPQALDAELLPASSIRIRNTVGMQVQVQMAVDVVQRQAGGAELLELRVNLRAAIARAGCAERNSGIRRRRGYW